MVGMIKTQIHKKDKVKSLPRRDCFGQADHEAGRRLGERLAEQIENEIIAKGWPVGEVIGSEQELLTRYQVSRATFREAVRLVDFHGVAKMRRGPGGGLVVTEPNLSAALRAMLLQLHFSQIKVEKVTEARIKLDSIVIDLAIQHLDSSDRKKLHAHLTKEEDSIVSGPSTGRTKGSNPTHDFHILLSQFSKNPVLELFILILSQLTGYYSSKDTLSMTQVAADVHHAHKRIAEALLAGDSELSKRRMSKHLSSVASFLDPSG